MDRDNSPISSDEQSLGIGASCGFPALPPPVDIRLTVLPENPCPYLPGRTALTRALWCESVDGSIYHRFMDAGFRRSGKLIYQPICVGCRACTPIRLAIETFKPSKSQRRSVTRNADIAVSIGRPVATDEKFEVYCRYLAQWHDREADNRRAFEQFLYDSPVDTLEWCYRTASGNLLAVGICDVCPESLSSVYFYFDPAEHRRGLGTFGVMKETEFARQMQIPHYYLGYYIDRCRSMAYKTSFRPFELLHPDGIWRPEGKN